MATDNFTAASPITGGSFAGDYAWSNLKNWSAGLPDQNTAAYIAASGYTLLIDAADLAQTVTFGYGAATGALNLLLSGGNSLTAGNGAVVAGGTTVTVLAASTGALTIAGGTIEVKASASFTMLGGSFTANTGGVTLDAGSSATFGPGVTFSVNTLSIGGNATLTLSNGSQGAPNVIKSVNDAATSARLIENGGNLQIGLAGAGIYTVANNGLIDFTTSLNSNASINLGGGTVLIDNNVTLQSGTSFSFASTASAPAAASTLDIVSSNNFQNGFGYFINGFDYGDKLQFGSLNFTNYVWTASSHTLSLTAANGSTVRLTSLYLGSDVKSGETFRLSGNTVQLACFLYGTQIDTLDGPKPVQDLCVGDRLITIEGGDPVIRPIRWIGRRRIQAARHGYDPDAYPVRIRAGAFAPSLPRRDLLVTGEHGIHVEGGLVPARMLVNGRSILRETSMARFSVCHVEFETHSIMLAEGLQTESYLDTGNRSSFAGSGIGTGLPSRSWAADAAAPLMVAREQVEPIWRELDRRCDLLGLAPAPAGMLCDDPGLAVRLADGRMLQARWQSAGCYFFHLPPGARAVRLLSRAARPCEAVGPFVDDRRRLGVAVSRITQWDGLADHVLPAADLAGDGWHELEIGRLPVRWTDGEAALPLPIAAGLDSFLEVRLEAALRYPAAAVPELRLAA